MTRSVRELWRRGGVAMAVAAILLASLSPAALSAQHLQFRHLGSAEGLANPWVSAILRDRRGFMWFGTATGLNRFDGYAMTLYRHRAGDARTLADPNVSALYEDRGGTLWVGTRSGLSRYDRARDVFTNYMVQSGLDLVERRQVYAILEDRAGRLWLGTSSGLFLFDRATGQDAELNLPVTDQVVRAVQALWEDERGHLWIGTLSNGLLDYDPATGRTRVYRGDPGDPTRLPANDIRAITGDGRGRLWVGTYDGGLALLDPRRGVVARYRHGPDAASIAVDAIRRILPDGAGGLWIGLENGGLDHFDPATGRFEHNQADPNRAGSLTSNSVWSLYQDSMGTLWVGTYTGGVHVSSRTSRGLSRHAVVPGDTTSLSNNSVLGFAQDSSGAIWVATDGGGLNRFDPATGRFRRYTTRNSNLNDDAVLSVAAGPDGDLWLATWAGGISRFDPRTGRFRAYTPENSDLPDRHIFSVHVDRAGRVWAGTWKDGLVRLDVASGTFVRYPIGRPGLQSQIWFIQELRDGRLLLGTMANGLLVFDPRTETMIRYRGEDSRVNSLSSSEVHAALETETGVWVGSAGGLDWLDRATGLVSHPHVAEALPGSMVSGLARDRAGFLWVTTDRGLARFDPRTGSSRLYTAPDGLETAFSPRAYLQTRDGALLFGSTAGFDVVHPDRLGEDRRRPHVVLTGLQLSNRPAAVGAAGSPLRAQLSETQQLTLGHRQSVFTIEFAALDFTAPARNEYAYRLDGFDRDWTYVGTQHSATYTGLPPGRYVFHVKASNSDGVWNDEGTALPITILPPFWKTWWFRTLVALLLVGTAGRMLFNLLRRRRRLESMNRQLAAAAERDRERQRYLESNVLEILGGLQQFAAGDYSVALEVSSDDPIGRLRQGVNTVMADRRRAEEELRQSQKMEAVGRLAGGIAHDFNNLLTVIKGNTTLALSGRESAEHLHEELNEVQHAAQRAESLTRQLLAFSRKQILQPRVLSLNDVVMDLERMLHRSVGEDVQIRTALEPALGMVRADRGQIEQVLLNLVVNARDAMPRGGLLSISTANVPLGRLGSTITPCVRLAVRDTGAGMLPEVKERVFEPFFTTKEAGKGTGLGLATVYGIVTQSGGEIHVESEPGAGATFTILLPRVVASQVQAEEPTADAVEAGSGIILLVEDEHALRRLATRVLERNGYTVLAAGSGPEALQVAGSYPGRIDLLLTDVVMPGMSGRQVAEHLLPRHPDMRLLYTSGYTEDDIVRHGVSGFTAAFLEKPFTPADLLRKVRGVLLGEDQVNAAD